MRLISLLFFFLISISLKAQNSTTVFLVRHAEKVDQSRDPELSLPGKARAVRLMELLQEAGIDKVYSTSYIRTNETVRPLAEKLNLEIEEYKPFDQEMVNALKSDFKGKSVLVSGHSNTIPALVNQLIKQEKFKQLDDKEYSKLFVVTFSEKEISYHVLNY